MTISPVLGETDTGAPPNYVVEERIAPVRFDLISTPARFGPHVTIDNHGEGYVVRVLTSARDKGTALGFARATVDRLLCLMSLRRATFSRGRRALAADVRSVKRPSSPASRQSKAIISFRVESHGYETFVAREADRAVLTASLEPRLQRALSFFYLGCCATDRKVGFVLHHVTLEVLCGENPDKVLDWLSSDEERESLLKDAKELFKERFGVPANAAERLCARLRDTKLESDSAVYAHYVIEHRAMAGTLAEVRKSLSDMGKQRGSIVHTGQVSDSGKFTKCRLQLESMTRKALISEMEHAVTLEPVGSAPLETQ